MPLVPTEPSKYNLDIKKSLEFPHNRNKNKTVWCRLEFRFNSYSKDYKYCVGYKPINYARFYYCAYSSESYEDALMKLWCDLEFNFIYNRTFRRS